MIHRAVSFHRQSAGARASLMMISAIAAASIGGYLFNLLAIRWLGAGDYGDIAVLISLTMLVLLPLAAVQNHVAREIAHLLAAGRREAVDDIARRWLVRMACVGVGLGGLIGVTAPLWRHELEIESLTSVWFAAATVAAGSLQPALQGVLQGVQRFGWFAGAVGLYALARPLLAPPFVLLGGVDGAMAACFVATLMPVAVCALGLRGAVDVRVRQERLAAPAVSSGLTAAIVGSTAFALLTNVDVIVAKAVLSDDDAGAYAAAALVGKLVLVGAAGVTIVLLPRVTVHLVEGTEHAARAIRRSLAAVAGLGLLTAAVVAPVPESAVLWLFGPTFGGARDLLAPCALAMTLAAVVQVMYTVSLAAGDHRYIAAFGAFAVLDVAALALLATTGLEILAVTAVCAGLAVVAYELTGPIPIHRLLRRPGASRSPSSTA